MLFRAWCKWCGYRIEWHERKRQWRRSTPLELLRPEALTTEQLYTVCVMSLTLGGHDPDPGRLTNDYRRDRIGGSDHDDSESG